MSAAKNRLGYCSIAWLGWFGGGGGYVLKILQVLLPRLSISGLWSSLHVDVFLLLRL